MKTQYRLIKKYPGSPKVGDIVEGYGRDGWYSKGEGHSTYDWRQVVNYPEFWEEVIEKDYEILSYIKKGSIACTTTKRRGGENHEEYWNIHSVKRLSDGEMFTIGDMIKTTYTERIRILGFRSPEANEYFIEILTGFTRLSTIEKVKQPIFLTHDGKDIFEGDTVWWVRKESYSYSCFEAYSGIKFHSNLNAYFLTATAAGNYINKNKVLFTTEDGVGIKKDEVVYVVDGRLNSIDMISNFVPKDYPTMKAFSTSQAAEDYIIENKYALSIKDFWDITCMSTSNFNKNTYTKDLVKWRLNLK